MSVVSQMHKLTSPHGTLAHHYHGRPSHVSSSPVSLFLLTSPQSQHSLSPVVYVSFSSLRTYSSQHPYSAEVGALLDKEREYVARINELTTNLGAFRAAYTTSQDDVKRKADESAALLAELHALKVCLPLSSPSPPHPSPRRTRNASSVSWMATELYSPQTSSLKAKKVASRLPGC